MHCLFPGGDVERKRKENQQMHNMKTKRYFFRDSHDDRGKVVREEDDIIGVSIKVAPSKNQTETNTKSNRVVGISTCCATMASAEVGHLRSPISVSLMRVLNPLHGRRGISPVREWR